MNLDKNLELLDGGKKLPLVEDFYTIQGEGFHTGKPAYFIRLGGCDVGCKWCDAKSTWNPNIYPPVEVETIVKRASETPAKAIVITGGEPLIYPLDYITEKLHDEGVEIFLETSGSHPFSGKFDWVCLSPKKKQKPLEEVYMLASEIKVIIETEEDIKWAEECAQKVSETCKLYLQPEWSVNKKMVPIIVEYVKNNPQWNISLQTHKFMRIP
ncbi:MAG: 7-carboxy-7-deazaguanine synthase QueE [Rikenellaceae bacterium]